MYCSMGEVCRIGGKRKVEASRWGWVMIVQKFEMETASASSIHPSASPLSRQNIAQTIFLTHTPVLAASTALISKCDSFLCVLKEIVNLESLPRCFQTWNFSSLEEQAVSGCHRINLTSKLPFILSSELACFCSSKSDTLSKFILMRRHGQSWLRWGIKNSCSLFGVMQPTLENSCRSETFNSKESAKNVKVTVWLKRLIRDWPSLMRKSRNPLACLTAI